MSKDGNGWIGLCTSCVFYWPATAEDDVDGRAGECRRYAPFPKVVRANKITNLGSDWPQVCRDDWCGEFRARNPE